MQSEVDNVAFRVGRLKISREPKHRHKLKSETELMNREDIKKFNVNRNYISQNQPWVSDALPCHYLPYRAAKWYPPIFCLGVALSLIEAETFARHLGLPADNSSLVHGYGIPGRLTELCGADPQVMVKRCDQGGSQEDWIWVFSLATNYDISKGVDVNGPLRKYREIVEGAFGPSKGVMWWMEYTTNHTPSHWWWWKHKPEWIDGWDPEWVYDD